MSVDMIDQKRKNVMEVLKIIKRCRAKGIDDETFARVYEPGEEIRISGSGKLTLLAMGSATRDLDYPVEENKTNSSKADNNTVKENNKVPRLDNLKLSELDDYADTSLGIDIKSFRTKPEKIAAIKSAIKNANN